MLGHSTIENAETLGGLLHRRMLGLRRRRVAGMRRCKGRFRRLAVLQDGRVHRLGGQIIHHPVVAGAVMREALNRVPHHKRVT